LRDDLRSDSAGQRREDREEIEFVGGDTSLRAPEPHREPNPTATALPANSAHRVRRLQRRRVRL